MWNQRRHTLRSRPLQLERLEDRLCLSQFLLVGDYSINGTVYRYDGTDGHYIDKFIPNGSGGLKTTEYLALDGTGTNLLIDGVEGHNVLRYQLADGSPNPAEGQTGAEFVHAGSGGLVGPEGIDYNPIDGNLYVANITSSTGGNVLRYDGTTGVFLSVFVASGVGGLGQANYLRFGPDGNLYVSSFNNGLLLRYDPVTGDPLPAPGRTGANFIDPVGQLANAFAFGPDGNLYLSVDDSGNKGSILRFNGVTGDPMPAPGQTGAILVPKGTAGMGFVDGITIGDDFNLYATDSDHGAIQRFDAQTGTWLGTFVFSNNVNLKNPGGLLFYDDSVPMALRSASRGYHQLLTAVQLPAGLLIPRQAFVADMETLTKLPPFREPVSQQLLSDEMPPDAASHFSALEAGSTSMAQPGEWAGSQRVSDLELVALNLQSGGSALGQ